MRKSGFYARLAAQSMRKNGKFYLPYLLTCIGASAMFYIMLYLNGNRGLAQMRGAGYVATVLFLGAIVIAIFSMILLFYTNSFLMKRRRRELGLYNILGMEKRHIGRVMFWETVYTALIGIVGGIAVGMLLSKLLLLLLCRLLRFAVPFGFEISVDGIVYTVIMYGAIFFLNLLTNLRRVGRAKPIELLYSGNVGEREPKTKWLLTALGLLTLGGGYYIAITVKTPLQALALFFIAVVLVIIGTYCLFTSGSIAVLKALRRNKKYYYSAAHFTTISGMLHRMKRNAAGLASICILSTMVLVTVSSTLCLYLGAEDSLDARYPYDFTVTYRGAGEGTVEATVDAIKTIASDNGKDISEVSVSKYIDTYFGLENGGLSREGNVDYTMNDESVVDGYFITDELYSRLTGQSVSLDRGELLWEPFGGDGVIAQDTEIMDMPFTARQITDFPLTGEPAATVARIIGVVVCEEDIEAIGGLVSERAGNNWDALIVGIGFDMDAGSQEQSDFYHDVFQQELDSAITGMTYETDGQGNTHSYRDGEATYEYEYMSTDCRAINEIEFYAMYGGFFFLGLFLGFLFLMATVLIIYYKQVSEGYEDVERFKIMQQVGMSEREVRRSIRSQILTVFFLPLLMAGVHIAAAFKMITRLLTIFSLYNVPLFAMCCAATLIVFAAIYALVYGATAKTYYRIVEQR